MRLKWNLRDTAFVGDETSVRGQSSQYIQWDRTCSQPQAPTFHTHEQMFRDDVPRNSFGWLIESKGLIPGIYKEVPKHLDKFQAVFTHDEELLKTYPDKCKFAPGGGIWLGGTVGQGSIGFHEKKYNISLVSSNKLMCPLHHFRYRLACRLSGSELVDVYGEMTGQPWVPIAETVEPYRFSIVIENDREPLRFTEKILNCFAAGCIPIYIGATKISQFFDAVGIIQTEPENILDAIKMATPEFYENHKPAVGYNLYQCRKYRVIEDYIWENHFAS